MSHLQLVASNATVPHPFRPRRERDARRTQLGLVGISGGRLLPVVIPTQPEPFCAGFVRRPDGSVEPKR